MANPCSITTAPDHLLLALCQRADVLGKEIDRITTNEAEESYADEQTAPLHEELGTIQRAIVDLGAHTRLPAASPRRGGWRGVAPAASQPRWTAVGATLK
jgi:hypothetical protein